jgi:ParB family chromosome partitioning protein
MADNIIEVAIEHVVVGERFRKDFGDLQALADSIKEIGLLQPIGIDAGYRLVFGERRLRAFKLLGRSTIPVRFVNLDSLLKGEHAENEFRKDFTVSERVEIGKALEGELAKRHGGDRSQQQAGKFSSLVEAPKGYTRDLAAKAAGFGNGKTYEQAKAVVATGAPELIEAVDKGEASVSAAEALLTLPKDEQAAVVKNGKKATQQAAKKEREKKRTSNAAVAPVQPAGTQHVLRILTTMDVLLRHLKSEGMDAAEMADVFMAEADLKEPAIADRVRAALPIMAALGRIADELEAAV